MVITGKIKTVKRIRYRNEECEGITKAFRQSFLIRIVHSTIKRNEFVEVLLHELGHLWMFICFTIYGTYLKDKDQHELMDKFFPRMSRQFLKLIKTKGYQKK